VSGNDLTHGLESVLSPADGAALSEDLADYLAYSAREALAPGCQGWWDDSRATMVPWGFELASPATQASLSPGHAAELEELRDGLPTVGGVLADLDRAGYVERHPDPADRRRTIAQIATANALLITQWLDGAASPIARVLDKLDEAEQQTFLQGHEPAGARTARQGRRAIAAARRCQRDRPTGRYVRGREKVPG
jgi:DNA-binding MarR family transcriptional regulator